MKRYLALIAFILLAHTSHAQTLKWRFPLPETSYTKALTTASLLANDGTGGSVFLLRDYVPAPEITFAGTRLVAERVIWLDRKGKLIHTIDLPGLHAAPPQIAALSPSVLHIRFLNAASDAYILRRVVRTAKGFTAKDIVAAMDEQLAEGPELVGSTDVHGYFTFKMALVPELFANQVVAILRYAP